MYSNLFLLLIFAFNILRRYIVFTYSPPYSDMPATGENHRALDVIEEELIASTLKQHPHLKSYKKPPKLLEIDSRFLGKD